MTADQQKIVDDFTHLVNMTPTELERWLDTEGSHHAGQSDTGGETKGHESGRRIVTLLRTNSSDYTDDDFAHMKRVRGYINRHLAQRPSGDVTDTTWRYSLMNWGHDPLK
ncbi:DUF3140 domain-containing protein [Actinopolyspora saharensis]|uniref:DNA-binding protein n=1 Tax=Actinopolyspora saharensis TaxID=995062 RepID=A0A1H0YMA9_9ACTN|nr:DUF3140 domain-containing protein [Actinopolyspora saharensis]SDQ16268.1 Protein of unknown function [Actinopolyspora saharensis]